MDAILSFHIRISQILQHMLCTVDQQHNSAARVVIKSIMVTNEDHVYMGSCFRILY